MEPDSVKVSITFNTVEYKLLMVKALIDAFIIIVHQMKMSKQCDNEKKKNYIKLFQLII